MSVRSAILILNHVNDRHLMELHAAIQQDCGRDHDVFLLSDRTRPSLAFQRKHIRAEEFRFTQGDLIKLGYPGKQNIGLAGAGQRNLKLGNAELPVLLFCANHRHYEHFWVVEYDVRYSGSWRQFFAAFNGNDAALLGTSLIRYSDFPGWSHWHSLAIPSLNFNEDDRLRGFFPVYRISNDALACLHEIYRQGCSGHMETLMPTALYRSGLRLEDIGGDGEFVVANNINRFYDNQRLTNDLSPGTFVYRPVLTATGAQPDRLWHPVKPKVNLATRLANRLWRELSR